MAKKNRSPSRSSALAINRDSGNADSARNPSSNLAQLRRRPGRLSHVSRAPSKLTSSQFGVPLPRAFLDSRGSGARRAPSSFLLNKRPRHSAPCRIPHRTSTRLDAQSCWAVSQRNYTSLQLDRSIRICPASPRPTITPRLKTSVRPQSPRSTSTRAPSPCSMVAPVVAGTVRYQAL